MTITPGRPGPHDRRRLHARAARAAGPRAALRGRGPDPQRGAGRAQPAATSPTSCTQRIKREAIEAGLSGGLHAQEYGGQGWTKTEWFLVEEQLGRSTNALSWHMPGAYNVLASGTPEQIDRYLRPALRGELHDAYAVTEADAGSDPSRIKTTAQQDRLRLGHRRREVVRDLRRRGRGLHRHGQGARGRPRSSPRCSSSTPARTASRSSTTRPSRTPTRTATPRSASPASRCPRTP